MAWTAPIHYLNQWWNIVNLTLRNKLHWNVNRNWYIFIQENPFENVIWEMSAILCRPQCVKQTLHGENHLKSGVGIWPNKFPPKHSWGPDWCCGLCLLRVTELWRLFAPDLRRRINSFSGSDFKPRLVYEIWYFCYFFTNFGHQF